jgi:DNA (cytosine-5)-methyltransferase 1
MEGLFRHEVLKMLKAEDKITDFIIESLSLTPIFGRIPTQLSMKRYRAIPIEGIDRFDLQQIVPELTPGCWIRKKSGGTDLFGKLW